MRRIFSIYETSDEAGSETGDVGNMKSNYFNFKKFHDRYLISNEQGRYYFLRPKDFEAFVKEDYAAMDPKVVEDLKDRFFLYNSEESVFVEKAMEAYR